MIYKFKVVFYIEGKHFYLIAIYILGYSTKYYCFSVLNQPLFLYILQKLLQISCDYALLIAKQMVCSHLRSMKIYFICILESSKRMSDSWFCMKQKFLNYTYLKGQYKTKRHTGVCHCAGAIGLS